MGRRLSQRQIFDGIVWLSTVVLAWASWIWVSGTPWFQVRYGDGGARARALLELAREDPDQAIPRLKGALADEDARVRMAAVDALTEIAESVPELAQPLLVSALETDDRPMAERALAGLESRDLANDRILGQVGDVHRRATDPLRARLAVLLLRYDPVAPEVAADALAAVARREAVGSTGPNTVREMLARPSVLPWLVVAMMGAGPGAVEAFELALATQTAGADRRALRVRALSGQSAAVRRLAVGGLAEDRPDLALALRLLDARADPDAAVGAAASETLRGLVQDGPLKSTLNGSEQQELLLRALDLEKPVDLPWLLELMPGAQPEPELLAHRAAVGNSPERRLMALELLVRAGGRDKSVVQALAAAYRDPDQRLRTVAVKAMQVLGGRTIGPLVDDLERGDRATRAQAARALAGVKREPDMAVRQLVRLAWNSSRSLRHDVIAAMAAHVPRVAEESRTDLIEALVGRFNDSDPSNRAAAEDAVRALGAVARPVLEESARRGPERVRVTSRTLLDAL